VRAEHRMPSEQLQAPAEIGEPDTGEVTVSQHDGPAADQHVAAVESYVDRLIAERTREMTVGVTDPRVIQALGKAVERIVRSDADRTVRWYGAP
jgi:hypothetical protein